MVKDPSSDQNIKKIKTEQKERRPEAILETITNEHYYLSFKDGHPNYEATIELARNDDPEGYKAGRLVFFSIYNTDIYLDPSEFGQPIVQYMNCKLSYDPNNKDVPHILEQLEDLDKHDGFIFDTLDWTKTNRDQISGRHKNNQYPYIKNIPEHLNPITKQANSPDFSFQKDTKSKIKPASKDHFEKAKNEHKERQTDSKANKFLDQMRNKDKEHDNDRER